MTSTAIRDRTAAAILDAAADLLAEGGESPSMSDVAEEAGVARATLYRYFPTRGELLQALAVAARDSLSARLDEADLDAVPVAEGIARVARAAAAVGSKYAVVVGESRAIQTRAEDEQLRAPIRSLLRRGLDDGTLRHDLSVEELIYLFGSLLKAAARLAAQDLAGVEKAAALVTSVFLHGTECRKDSAL